MDRIDPFPRPGRDAARELKQLNARFKKVSRTAEWAQKRHRFFKIYLYNAAIAVSGFIFGCVVVGLFLYAN